MPKKKTRNLTDFIEPLYMNGMQGRMLRLPPPANKKREILLVYGHHASIERMFGIAEYLNRYGGVTLPDLPGFGGMDAFYKIGEKPTLDNLADYMAAFVKLRYKRRRVTIVAMSFGFVIVTRMLQRYPELTKRVDVLVSFVGFAHRDDFKLKRTEYWAYRSIGRFGSWLIPGWFIKHFIFRPAIIRFMYTVLAPKHAKLKDADEAEQKARIEFEIYLWQCNDVRTRGYTAAKFFNIDLCNKRVDLPLYHVAVKDDHYFDNQIVEQHLNVIYNSVDVSVNAMLAHAPTVIADAAAAAPFIPVKIRRVLSKPS
jgi:pimeloyl-ACP methyl ester carboxylesterase